MDFTTRRARPQEHAYIGELIAQAYLDDGLLDHGAADPYLARLRDTTGRAEHAEVLVAVRDVSANTVEPNAGTQPEAHPGPFRTESPAKAEEPGPEAGPTAGAVLGTVTFAAGGELAQVAGPGEGEFRMLAVSHAARGRGIGETLVRECLDRARNQGLSRVVLSSAPLMSTAHRLYERLGFRRTPARDWEPRPGRGLWTFAVELPASGRRRHNI